MAAGSLPSSDNRYAVRLLQAFYNDYHHKCPLTTVKHNLDNSSLLEAIKVNFAAIVMMSLLAKKSFKLFFLVRLPLNLCHIPVIGFKMLRCSPNIICSTLVYVNY